MFQYPGDSKSPSKRRSPLIISRISRIDFVGVIGGVDRVNALYFCFASTYLYRKSRSMQAIASAKPISKNQFLSALPVYLPSRPLHCLVRMHMPDGLMDDKLRLSKHDRVGNLLISYHLIEVHHLQRRTAEQLFSSHNCSLQPRPQRNPSTPEHT